MLRQIIIIVLVALIIAVLAGTGYFVMQRLDSNQNEPAASESPPALLTDLTPNGSAAPLANPNADEDGDGLTNAQEALWGSDPSNPDTDGDSYTDGQEVAAGHNPLIAGPNDKLPEGFNGQPLPSQGAGLPQAPLKPDQYFVENLDLSGGKDNLTDKYKGDVKETDRNADTLAAFVNQQPIVNKLPEVKADALQVSENSGSASINEYLNKIGSLAALTDRSLLSQALSDLYTSNDTGAIKSFLLQAQLYQNQLKAVKVPAQAVQVHRMLLGYTQLFIATTQQITKWNEDSVKAMVAVRQLNVNDQAYMPIILGELKRLRTLANGQ